MAHYHLEQKSGWTVMIKELRASGHLSLHEAFAVALAHDGWNRWCRWQITQTRRCASQYLSYLAECDRRRETPVLLLSDNEIVLLREQFGLGAKRYNLGRETP